MDDKIWIACHLKSEPRAPTAVGWTRCQVCHAKVWIAAASIAVKSEHPNVTIACLDCFTEAVLRKKLAGEPCELHTTEQQEIEMFKATGQTATEAFQRIFGVTPKKL